MLAFEIWGKFASFRDPFTISQNISLPIPPKTTVAGMMASILGVEEYFGDKAFHSFEYSIIPLAPISKKSFSQNYINDYTSKTQTHINNLVKNNMDKISEGLRDKKNPQKPINREILLNPRYLIVIKDFEYETKLEHYLKEKISKFAFFLGNSEFAGNFRYVSIEQSREVEVQQVKVDSFILEEDLERIVFEENIRYSNLSFATMLDEDRGPTAFVTVILGSQPISLEYTSISQIKCYDRVYHCRFV